MIAITVLSIGVLGIATLQLSSKRSNFEATQHATASYLVQGLLERIRANPTALGSYNNDGSGLTLSGTTLSSISCSAGCTPSQMAQYDLFQWEQSISGAGELLAGAPTGGLVSARACITGPAGISGNYTIAIAWRGTSDLIVPITSTCGQGSGLYDSSTGNDVRRRVLSVQTFITVPI